MPSRILVVEDDAPLSETIATVLRFDGFGVDTASDGRRAIEKLEVSEFDVIILDIRMPGLDGPGLYRELAVRKPALLPRIIFTTGDMLTEWVRTFLDSVGGQQLHKPFDIDDMRRAIRNVVDLKAAG